MPASRPLRERFLEKVLIYDFHEDDCWEWIGAELCSSVNKERYGLINLGTGRGGSPAHRASWEIFHGSIPKGMLVCHKCDWTKCVNPNHLFLGTHLANSQDKYQKGRNRNPIGLNHGNSKLNPDSIRSIRKMIRDGVTYKDVAARFGVHKSTVGFIATKRTWRHVT